MTDGSEDSGVNIELLDRVMERIHRDPLSWNQRVWGLRRTSENICGTAYCFAGHAVVEEDYEPWFGQEISEYDGVTIAEATLCVGPRTEIPSGQPSRDSGIARDIDQVAIELLRISDEDADLLFDPDNDLDALERMVAELKEHGTLAYLDGYGYGYDDD